MIVKLQRTLLKASAVGRYPVLLGTIHKLSKRGAQSPETGAWEVRTVCELVGDTCLFYSNLICNLIGEMQHPLCPRCWPGGGE